MYDPVTQEEGVQGWELAQFLPEDEELFSFESPAKPSPSLRKGARQESPFENVLKDHYRIVLARNRQKLLAAQKHMVRSRVALHEAYRYKIEQLTAPLPPLREGEFLVTSTTNGPSVHTLSGDRQPISWGHIMSGFEWGIEYVLDPATFSYDERHTYINRLYKHRVALLDAEHELLELLVDAYKDESPEMAEAIKMYRDRYRALFNIETGVRHTTSEFGLARAEKILRSFLTGLTYDFPQFALEVRYAHPIEDVGYGIQLIISRTESTPEHTVRLSITDLSKDLQALNPHLVIERAFVKPHLDPSTLTSSTWREKLERYDHAKRPLLISHINLQTIENAFQAWYAQTDLLEQAIYTPEKQLPRDFWAMIINDIFNELLTPVERQLIMTTL